MGSGCLGLWRLKAKVADDVSICPRGFRVWVVTAAAPGFKGAGEGPWSGVVVGGGRVSIISTSLAWVGIVLLLVAEEVFEDNTDS